MLASDADFQATQQHSSYAVFAMHPESPEPVSAITVVPTETGTDAEITDLRPPGGSHIAPYPSQEQLDRHDHHA